MKFIGLNPENADSICRKILEKPEGCSFAVFKGCGCPPDNEMYINLYDYDEIQKEYGCQSWYIAKLQLWFGDFLFAGKCYALEKDVFINWDHPAAFLFKATYSERQTRDLVSKIKEFLF